jgi:hypothetical protein
VFLEEQIGELDLAIISQAGICDRSRHPAPIFAVGRTVFKTKIKSRSERSGKLTVKEIAAKQADPAA